MNVVSVWWNQTGVNLPSGSVLFLCLIENNSWWEEEPEEKHVAPWWNLTAGQQKSLQEPHCQVLLPILWDVLLRTKPGPLGFPNSGTEGPRHHRHIHGLLLLAWVQPQQFSLRRCSRFILVLWKHVQLLFQLFTRHFNVFLCPQLCPKIDSSKWLWVQCCPTARSKL